MGIIDYKTMEVRLRISSNMLEKLFLQNIITKDEFIWLDMNLKLFHLGLKHRTKVERYLPLVIKSIEVLTLGY